MIDNAATLWADGSFRKDTWKLREEAAPVAGDVIITLADWQDEEAIWRGHDGRLGLSVHGGDDIDAVAEILENFDLVVVNFPSFSDGRAFTLARLIRDKYAFEGAIRARGAYILDQMPMLMRCGVSEFEVSSAAVRAGLKRGAWPDMPRYYQFALDGTGKAARTRPVDAKRPWLSLGVLSDDARSLNAA